MHITSTRSLLFFCSQLLSHLSSLNLSVGIWVLDVDDWWLMDLALWLVVQGSRLWRWRRWWRRRWWWLKTMIDDRGGRSARERDPITGPPLSSSPAHLTDHHSDSETDPPENSYDCYFIMFVTTFKIIFYSFCYCYFSFVTKSEFRVCNHLDIFSLSLKSHVKYSYTEKKKQICYVA